MFHPTGMPSMPDRRTYNKLGEHGEHEKDAADQPDDLKHSFMTQNNLFVTQNTLFGNQMT